jgi:hypothetical protein
MTESSEIMYDEQIKAVVLPPPPSFFPFLSLSLSLSPVNLPSLSQVYLPFRYILACLSYESLSLTPQKMSLLFSPSFSLSLPPPSSLDDKVPRHLLDILHRNAEGANYDAGDEKGLLCIEAVTPEVNERRDNFTEDDIFDDDDVFSCRFNGENMDESSTGQG